MPACRLSTNLPLATVDELKARLRERVNAPDQRGAASAPIRESTFSGIPPMNPEPGTHFNPRITAAPKPHAPIRGPAEPAIPHQHASPRFRESTP
jgi:hypothetical protein